jgi:hypothetical protein
MNWLALLKSVLAIAQYISGYVKDEQLLKAGEARALSKQLEVLNERFKKAEEARAASVAHSNTGGLLDDDGHKRD